jgi:hypothetical protein
MTDVEKMFAALDEEPWATMKILADALADAGDVRVIGYRLLAEHKKMPQVNQDGEWYWNPVFLIARDTRGSMIVECWQWELPISVFKNKRVSIAPPTDSDNEYESRHFDTREQAYDAAALAWSEEIIKRQKRKQK